MGVVVVAHRTAQRGHHLRHELKFDTARRGRRPEIRFALAAAQAASGADEAALNAYTALHADTPLGQAARFNSANVLLREATRVQAGPQPGQAIR